MSLSNLTRTNPLYFALAAASLIFITAVISPGVRQSPYLNSYSTSSSSSSSSSHYPEISEHTNSHPYTPSNGNPLIRPVAEHQHLTQDFAKELQRKLSDSEEMWRRSVAKREAFYAEKGGIDRVPLFGDPGQHSIWDILTAPFACPFSLERIGRLGDGGKWICGPDTLLNRGSKGLIYSIGVERESSFEAEMLDRYPEATVYGYDLSVDNWGPQIHDDPKYNGRAHFNKYGLSAHDEPNKTPPNYSLKSMLAQNGHDFIDIFKIDVEGSEWEVLEAILDDYKGMELPFGQMQIEVHAIAKGAYLTVERMDRWWRALEAAGLRAFVLEINHPTVPVTGMYYAEYCFINVKSTKSPLLGY